MAEDHGLISRVFHETPKASLRLVAPKILCRDLLFETPWTSQAHPLVCGSTDREEKGSQRFQIRDVIGVATGGVRGHGGRPVEMLKAQGLRRPTTGKATFL